MTRFDRLYTRLQVAWWKVYDAAGYACAKALFSRWWSWWHSVSGMLN